MVAAIHSKPGTDHQTVGVNGQGGDFGHDNHLVSSYLTMVEVGESVVTDKKIELPVRIVTLGLFTLVVNVALMGALIWLGEAADTGLSSDSVWAILLGGLVLTVIASILSHVID